jgi:alanyl-tRNA synthetase
VRYHYRRFDQAIEEGALAFFGEKYGDEVRVVEVSEDHHAFSKELCGGTHCAATGQIGLFLVISEGSIGAGMRRIEALTGRAAEAYVQENLALIGRLSRRLNVPAADIERRIEALQEELEAERRRGQAAERDRLSRFAESLAGQARVQAGIHVLVSRAAVESTEALRQLSDLLRRRLGESVVLLAAVIGDGPKFVAAATPAATARGIHAGNILRQVAAVTGGNAGGRPEMAQGGGREADRLDDALQLGQRLIQEQLQAGR